MITASGYSKDPFIMPEGIVVTFGKEMIAGHGGLEIFTRYFEECMAGGIESGDYWMHKMSNLPTKEFDKVYISMDNKLYGRVNFGGVDKGVTIAGVADGSDKEIDWQRIILAGPLELCPFERELPGFQGFRYCTKLW